MKKYVNPQFELVALSTSDAITASYAGKNGDCYGFDFFDDQLEL